MRLLLKEIFKAGNFINENGFVKAAEFRKKGKVSDV